MGLAAVVALATAGCDQPCPAPHAANSLPYCAPPPGPFQAACSNPACWDDPGGDCATLALCPRGADHACIPLAITVAPGASCAESTFCAESGFSEGCTEGLARPLPGAPCDTPLTGPCFCRSGVWKCTSSCPPGCPVGSPPRNGTPCSVRAGLECDYSGGDVYGLGIQCACHDGAFSCTGEPRADASPPDAASPADAPACFVPADGGLDASGVGRRDTGPRDATGD